MLRSSLTRGENTKLSCVLATCITRIGILNKRHKIIVFHIFYKPHYIIIATQCHVCFDLPSCHLSDCWLFLKNGAKSCKICRTMFPVIVFNPNHHLSLILNKFCFCLNLTTPHLQRFHTIKTARQEYFETAHENLDKADIPSRHDSSHWSHDQPAASDWLVTPRWAGPWAGLLLSVNG